MACSYSEAREIGLCGRFNEESWSSGFRHSVSEKMRTAPPAVRTYSTLPLDIQL